MGSDYKKGRLYRHVSLAYLFWDSTASKDLMVSTMQASSVWYLIPKMPSLRRVSVWNTSPGSSNARVSSSLFLTQRGLVTHRRLGHPGQVFDLRTWESLPNDVDNLPVGIVAICDEEPLLLPASGSSTALTWARATSRTSAKMGNLKVSDHHPRPLNGIN